MWWERSRQVGLAHNFILAWGKSVPHRLFPMWVMNQPRLCLLVYTSRGCAARRTRKTRTVYKYIYMYTSTKVGYPVGNVIPKFGNPSKLESSKFNRSSHPPDPGMQTYIFHNIKIIIHLMKVFKIIHCTSFCYENAQFYIYTSKLL